MPSVTLERKPSGLPTASAIWPTWSLEESANLAALRPGASTWITARSSAAKVPTSVPLTCLPLARVTLKVFEVPTTWLFVTMSPLASKTMPEPSPSEVWIWTTEGSTALTTPSYSCWSCWATEEVDVDAVDCWAFGARLVLGGCVRGAEHEKCH